jgi:hypothetical protein
MLSRVFAPRLLSSERSDARSVSVNRDSEAMVRETPLRPTLVSKVPAARPFWLRIAWDASAVPPLGRVRS